MRQSAVFCAKTAEPIEMRCLGYGLGWAQGSMY